MRAAFVICFLITIDGLLGIYTGEGIYRGVPIDAAVYPWTTGIGIIGCIWHLRAIIKEKKKPPSPAVPLDDQCSQAKADLDRMYFREHGKMPDYEGAEQSASNWFSRTYHRRPDIMKRDENKKDGE